MPSAPKWLFDTVDFFMSKLPLLAVDETTYLSPSVKRIGLKGDFKDLHFPVGAFFDFRVTDTDARRYTVSHVNVEKNHLEFIAYIHGKGCGSDYMQQLEVGDTISLNKPRGEQKYYDKSAEKLVIFGDETSLALACSFLPVLKKNKHLFQFIFELDDENKKVPELLGLENSLVFPKNNLFSDPNWINDLTIFKIENWQDAYYVLTGNVKSVQTFKKVIKSKANTKVKLHGYWLEGKKGL